MIGGFGRALVASALATAGAACAQATLEYHGLDALVVVPRAVSVGTSLGHASPVDVAMPADARAKTYASNVIAPFVSVRVSLTSKDGTLASRDLFDYEKLGVPNEQRLTVREVEESDPKALAALLLPFIQRRAADWRASQLAGLCGP